MAVIVDIADRQYDYTDEEKAAEAVAAYQAETGMDDAAILALWADEGSADRSLLESRIFDALDSNGSAKRARETIPGGIFLIIETEAA